MPIMGKATSNRALRTSWDVPVLRRRLPVTIDQAVAKALGKGPDYMPWNEAIRGLGTELWQKGGRVDGKCSRPAPVGD